VASTALIRACVITNGLRTVRAVKWLPVNNETMAAIMIVGNALFNDSSDESSHEERAIVSLEPKQERCNSIPIIRNMHYQYSLL